MANKNTRQQAASRAVQIGAALAIALWSAGVWAQSDFHLEFKSGVEQKLEARSEARKAGDDPTALRRKGYSLIGTISASRPGETSSPEAAKLLEAAILKKAAESGGDVVRLEKEAVVEVLEAPTGETKKTCLHSHFTNEKPAAEVCDDWKETTVTQQVKSIVSSGTVWRLDASLSAALRRELAESLRQGLIKDNGGNVPPGFNVSTQGPDDTEFLYRVPNITPAICNNMMNEIFIGGLRERSFVKFICTDGKNTTLNFDLAAMPISVGYARKAFAQTNRDATYAKIGKATAEQIRLNISAEGPDATEYVFHSAGVTSAACNKFQVNSAFVAKLRELGFTKLVCTDDGNARFSFDLPK